MKHFVYKIETLRGDRNGNRYQCVHVWRIVRGRLILLGKEDFTFKGDFQAAFELIEKLKALPKKVFVRSEATNCHTYGSSYGIEAAGIATIQQI